MSSPRLTTVLLPHAKGSSFGGEGAGPPHGKCPWRQAAATKTRENSTPTNGEDSTLAHISYDLHSSLGCGRSGTAVTRGSLIVLMR
jgi:hypothetical protein